MGERRSNRRRRVRKECRAPAGSEIEERPYRELALIYDELVGDTAFECWKENHERLVDRYGIKFKVAADVACGTGNAARYLAGTCNRVYGVDVSPEMLEVAGEKVSAPNVVLLEGSFTGFELPEEVDLLTCNFDSLNYLLREEEVARALSRFGRFVRSGGYCIFDMNTTRELEVEWGTSVSLHRVSGAICVWEFDWDPEMRTSTLMMTNFFKLGNGLFRMSEEVHRERSYETDIILGLLNDAGFSRADAFDARDLTGVNEQTRRVQFIARK
jgi:ubiquinone/menaquinone biosynthesis C-methylase UbiE